MSSLASLLGDVQSEIKIDPLNRVWSQSTKEKAINDAYTKVQKDGQYGRPENQDFVTIAINQGTQEYALPTDFRQIMQVSLPTSTTDSQFRLSKCTKAWALMQGTLQQGQPYTYYVWQNKIGFYQVPNKAYTINLLYSQVLPKLTSTQDSLLPEEFDRAIALYAAYMLNMQPGGREQIAQMKLQEYNEIMDTLKLTFLYQDLNGVFAYQRSGSMIAPYGGGGTSFSGVGTSFNANS